MKKIKDFNWSILMVSSLIILFSSCQKSLDRKPLTATMDDLPGGGLEGQVFGLYNALRSDGNGGDGFNSLPFMCMHSIRSDEAIYAVDPGAASYKPWLDHFQYDKTAWFSGLYWSDHYKVIGNANTALQFADSLKLADSASTVFIAEARFVRAYSYFDLVRTYGQVPLITKRVYNSAEGIVAKSPEADIYAQIDADLDFADQHLPKSWEGTAYNGRLTSGASKTLHAKTYLFREQWAKGLAATNDIIQSGVYSLNTNYYSNFNYASSLGPESIFEYQAFGSAGGTIRYDCEWAEPQQVRGSGDWNLGWGWNIPDTPLIKAFEPNDPRLNATILFSGKSDGGIYGTPNMVPDTPTISSLYWNKKVYTDPAIRKAYGDQGSHFLNHLIYRYADVLLMNAECANELGDGVTAENNLEMIRARARAGNNLILPHVAFVSQAQMRTALQHEKEVEFGMEAERFFDLVRWHLAVQVLGPAGYTDKNKYYPLPDDAVKQSNGVLIQNPDY